MTGQPHANKEKGMTAEQAEIARLHGVIDKLLAHCPDGECHECGAAVCPHADPLHFHHDGCPSCAQAEEAEQPCQN